MYKGLINSLTYMYSLVANGRGKLDGNELNGLNNAAKLTTSCAAKLAEDETKSDRIDLNEAKLINDHIEAMVVFQLANGEIC